jgi:hypothetical protein
MSSNLPAKTIEQILKTDDAKLSKQEQELKKQLMQERAIQESPETHRPKPLRIEVAHQSQLFKMPDGKSSETIKVVIISSIITRGYWKGKNEDSKLLCQSIGGSVGNPTEDGAKLISSSEGVLCSACPFGANEFGSADGGAGKACKEMRKLLVFHPDYKGGLLLTIPPSSISAYDNYYTSITTSGKILSAMWTKIKLEKKTKGSMTWSKFNFEQGDLIYVEDFTDAMNVKKTFAEALGIVEDEDYPTKPAPKKDDEDLPF